MVADFPTGGIQDELWIAEWPYTSITTNDESQINMSLPDLTPSPVDKEDRLNRLVSVMKYLENCHPTIQEKVFDHFWPGVQQAEPTSNQSGEISE